MISNGPANAAVVRPIAISVQELALGCVSTGLLVLSSMSDDAVGNVVKLAWLASVAVLCVANIGLALAVYLIAASMYSVHRAGGWPTIFERPDNYALLLIFASLFLLRRGNRLGKLMDRIELTTVAFLAYFILQSIVFGIFSRITFAWFMRSAGLPFLLYALLRRSALKERELRALFLGLTVLGTYTALVSIFERLGWYDVIVPPWIGDPAMNQTFGGGRAGGLLMQSEWNGFALSLLLCVMLLPERMYPSRLPFVRVPARLVTVAAIFFTYTRGAWAGTALSALTLGLRRSRSGALTYLRALGVGMVTLAALLVLVLRPSVMVTQRLSDVTTVYYRLNLWEAARRMIADHPLFGVGFAQFGQRGLEYLDPAEAAWGSIDPGAEWEYRQATMADPVHNTPLSIAVELGLIGLALWGYLVLLQLLEARRASAHLWGSEGRRWVLAFALVYFVNVQFVVAHELVTNMLYFGTLGAITGHALGSRSAEAKV
jgi:O-antigen ligase